MDTDMLLQVGRMAHDLHVYPAVVYCAERLLDFQIDYLCSILDFGELIQDPELIQRCVEFIQNKAHHIFEAESFLNYTASKIEVILRQETIYNVTELQLFQACLTWSNGKPNEVESRRAALGPMLGLIRFRLISTEDFGKHVCPTGLLSTEHERDIFRSCATGEDYMPEGFSNSTKSRDPSQLMVLKICSSGERKSLEEFIKQKRYSSFQFHVNKESFIHGVQLLAFRSNLPDGQVYDEHVYVSIEHLSQNLYFDSLSWSGEEW
ncbi:hypothetical protein B566_EDAN017348 [Ephemera danica]|nr:hypothetical protein B566_EDAN017348 [Ephemera danica]